MARLPQVSNRTAIFEGPQSAVSGAAAANPYMQIADAMGTIGTKLEEQAVIKAEQQGADAVYRDDSGNLQVDQRSNWSKSGQAYNRAAQQAYAARVAGDVRKQGLELTNAAQGDVAAFDTSWKAFSDQLLANTPKEYRGPLKTMLETNGSQFSLGVSEQKRKRDLTVFENDIKTEIQFLDNDMAALARAGGTGTAAYQEKQSQLQSLYGELVNNPEFTVSDKQAAMEMQRVESRHMSEAIVGSIDKTLTTGGVKAAQKEAERILTDEKLHLSPAERRQYAGLAEQRITGFVAEQKVALKPFQDQAANFKKHFDQGDALDNPEVDTVIASLARGGDVVGALDLQASRRKAQVIQQFGLASPEARVAALERGRAAANGVRLNDKLNITGLAYPGASSNGEVSLDVIRKHEGFRERPYWDVNAHRVGYGSDTITTADGTILRVTTDMQVSREDAERDLRRRVGEFQQGIRQDIGGQQWMGLGENVKAALTSVAYNYGSLPKSVVAAAKSGDANAIASAIEGLKGHNSGVNSRRRQEEADLVRGGTSVSGSASIDPEVIKAYRSGVTADVKDSWPEIKDMITKGNVVASNELSLLTRQLSLIDDPQLKREISSFFNSEAATSMFASMPPQQSAAIIDQLKVDAGDGSTVAQQQILEAAERTAKRTAEAMQNDPIGYGAQRQWTPSVPAIDLAAGPDVVGSAFAARQNSINLLEARGMIQPGASALRPQDKAVLNQIMTQGTPGEKAQLFGAMSKNLSPKTYMATMGALAGDANSRTAASAGALYQYNPQVAEGVLRGQALLKDNPNFAPKKTDENQTSIDEILPPQAFGAGLEGSRQLLLDSARARYADLSNTVGDTSGNFNQERMSQAINEVTGGLIDFNGQNIVAPQYGMSQGDFDGLITNMTDDALSGAITSEGQQITASDLRRYGRLRSVGDGRYLLEFGLEDAPTFAMSKPVMADSRIARAGGGPFILDLRGDE